MLLPSWHRHAAARGIVAGFPASVALTYTVFFAVAIAVYSAVWADAPVMAPDSWGYLRVAQDLADFRIDTLSVRPVGYPALLVLTGASEGGTRLLFYTSLFLHFCSVWMIGAVLYRMGLNSRWVVVCGALLLLPPYAEYTAYGLSENLSQFLLVLSFSSMAFWYLYPRSTGLLLISAVAIAASGFTRPTYQILALVVGGFIMISRAAHTPRVSGRDRITAALVVVTVSAILLGSFSALNYQKFGFFGVYPMTGLNLSTRTVNVLERLPEEYAIEREILLRARNAAVQARGEPAPYLSYLWAMELEKATGLNGFAALSSHMLRLHLTLIKRAPLNYAREVLSSFAGLWLPSATEVANMGSGTFRVLWALVQLSVVTLFIFQLVVIAGLLTFRVSQRWVAAPLSWPLLNPDHLFAYGLAGTIVFYNAVATSLVEVGDPRYRVPTEPLLVCMCFLGFHIWRTLLAAPPAKLSEPSSRNHTPASV